METILRAHESRLRPCLWVAAQTLLRPSLQLNILVFQTDANGCYNDSTYPNHNQTGLGEGQSPTAPGQVLRPHCYYHQNRGLV